MALGQLQYQRIIIRDWPEWKIIRYDKGGHDGQPYLGILGLQARWLSPPGMYRGLYIIAIVRPAAVVVSLRYL